ncbi:MAG TPA: RsmG family class I SAM-dependent methyltransferase [Acidimicrobiales bacterium]|nr:RsmG family class I SAM-dependent methyltransferase [Acidimicrobiales bacterium]
MGDALDAVLERSRALGFLGPGAIAEQRRHAEAFQALLPDDPALAVDLGSGGGLPGLVLAAALPRTRWVLLDAMTKRTAFLEGVVLELGWQERVEVVTGRAEDLARARRATVDVVVARGFGPPAVTAECGAPLLRAGGVLVVSEPPGSTGERWPAAGLAELGLALDTVVAGPPAFARLLAATPCPQRYPRRTGVPAKRPLFHVER